VPTKSHLVTAKAELLKCGSLPCIPPHDAHRYCSAGRLPPLVMGESQLGVLYLAFLGLTPKLEVALIEHPHPAGAYGVAEALETPIGLHRQLSSEEEGTGLDARGLNSRSSMTMASVIEKQSCTSARLICRRGLVIPASA